MKNTHLFIYSLVVLFSIDVVNVEAGLQRLEALQTVAVTDLAYASLPPGTFFYDFLHTKREGHEIAPAVNNNGLATFAANLTGEGVNQDNDYSIWSAHGGQLRLLAREGQQAPGTPEGYLFYDDSASRGLPNVAEGGRIVFGATVKSPSEEILRGLWIADEGNDVQLLALQSMSLPMQVAPFPGATVAGVEVDAAINDFGHIAFAIGIREPRAGVTTNGIYLYDGTQSLRLVESGQFSPGVDAKFQQFLIDQPTLNNAGQTVVNAIITGAGIVEQNDNGIWRFDRNGGELLLRENSTPVGLNEEAIFYDHNGVGTPFSERLLLNNVGQMVTEATIFETAFEGREGIWRADESSSELLAYRQLTTVAGTPDWQLSTFSFSGASFNNAGEYAFAAKLLSPAGDIEGNTEEVILRSSPIGVQIVARQGDQPPETSEGSFFLELFSSDRGVSLNERGDIAFHAFFSSPDLPAPNVGSGIFAADAMGTLRLVIATGDEIEIAPGDNRIVSDVRYVAGSGNADGRRGGFADDGRLTLIATFSDGSEGVFTSSLLVVPESSSAFLLLIAFLQQTVNLRQCKRKQ